MENIYLVGFMGTGKTSVGKELAKRKKWQFVDLDDLIELREKKTINDIFVKEGEPYFRKIEKLTLREAAGQKNFVVACGGGIVIDEANIRTMQATGRVICLSASVDVILKRTSQAMHRPLLKVADPRKQIEMLLKLRVPYYAKAGLCIDTSKLSAEEVVEKVLKITTKVKNTKAKAKEAPI